MSHTDDDRHEIRQLIEKWAPWRDAGECTVKDGLPGLTGTAVGQLSSEGTRWLAGN